LVGGRRARRRLPFALALSVAFSWACTPPEEKAAEAGAAAAEASAGGKLPLPSDADMIKEAKGVGLGELTEPQTTSFFQIINTEVSPCKRSESLAKSLRDDDKCRDSMVVSQFIADSLASGASTTQIKGALDRIVDALTPKEIPVKGRPSYGSDNAPVTVVVFADFECPHCRAEAPKLRQTIDQFKGRARLVYKHFPLDFHEFSTQAAIATEAALDQGKFWEMHDIVFANSSALTDADLLRYAGEIGLDVAKFKASLAKPEAAKRVSTDRKDGETLGLSGTPTVYVNGRLMNNILFGGSLAGWIDDALKR